MTVRAIFGGASTLPPPADVAKAPADAEVTATGLASKVLQVGDGTDSPSAVDEVSLFGEQN
jgi:peptidylprolyl isomerase